VTGSSRASHARPPGQERSPRRLFRALHSKIARTTSNSLPPLGGWGRAQANSKMPRTGTSWSSRPRMRHHLNRVNAPRPSP